MATTDDRRVALLCEDEELVLTILSSSLSSHNYRVIETSTPDEALIAACENSTIDVLVTDYSLDEMSGLALAREVRKLQPGCPVVVITGQRAQDLDVDPTDRDHIHVLEKPFDPADLLSLVTRLEADSVQ